MKDNQNWISITVNLKEVASEVPPEVYVLVKDEIEVLNALIKIYGYEKIYEAINNWKKL